MVGMMWERHGAILARGVSPTVLVIVQHLAHFAAQDLTDERLG